MRKLLLLLCTVITTLCGCYYEDEVIQNELENEDATVLTESQYKENQTTVSDEIVVLGEEFSLLVTYDTGDLSLNDWRVTSNKRISMEVKTKNLPEGYQAYVEHVHADIMLKATAPRLDGICHDSMDDSDHRVPTSGFPISNDTSYHNIFSIEGYNSEFYEIWGYTMNGMGYTESAYSRLTEKNIREFGCYAEKLAVVYDIVIVKPDGTEYVRSVYSDVLIPLVGELNVVTFNAFTGEPDEPLSRQSVEEATVQE